jgi:hypothetical protein
MNAQDSRGFLARSTTPQPEALEGDYSISFPYAWTDKHKTLLSQIVNISKNRYFFSHFYPVCLKFTLIMILPIHRPNLELKN